MIKKLTSFLIVTIFLFCITCCKVNISEEKNPFMPVIVPKMVKVYGGTINGENNSLYTSKGSFPSERRVKLSDFYIGKYEITQEQYYSVMWDQKVTVKGIDGVKFQLEPKPSYCQADSDVYHSFEGEIQEKRPVEGITWFDAIWFCNALSKKEKLNPAYKITVTEVSSVNLSSHITDAEVEFISSANGYRLPTECEFEYASRGGDVNAPDWNFLFSGKDTESSKAQDNVNTDCDKVAWYRYNNRTGESSTSGNREDDTYYSYKGTHEVGKRNPNRLGLYDMSGNVSEFCYAKINWDNIYPKYSGELEINPVRLDENGNHIFTASGSWRTGANACYVHNFAPNMPGNRNDTWGFRVVRSAK